MNNLTWFIDNVWTNSLMIIFTILALGYALGRIKICGLDLGTAGVLLVALVFGHFGVVLPDVVGDLGLICFVTAVGYIAGPKFFRNLKANATSYILIGLVTIISGALVCVGVIKLFDIPTDIGVGLMSGALTSTPGLAAAKEAAGVNAAVGYGIAYPFGVVGVVLFVQLVPSVLNSRLQQLLRKKAKRKRKDLLLMIWDFSH